MSYGVNLPSCHLCGRLQTGCTDRQAVMDVVSKDINQSRNGGHQGYGQIIHICNNMAPRLPEEPEACDVASPKDSSGVAHSTESRGVPCPEESHACEAESSSKI